VILSGASAALVSSSQGRPAPAPLCLPLAVLPEHARATVDGRDTPVRDGKLLLSGLPGDVRTVRLEADGRSVESVVAITGAGLVPPRVAVPASARPGPRRPNVTPSALPDAPKPKPKPKLDSDWPG
jgi:hypothetical protein